MPRSHWKQNSDNTKKEEIIMRVTSNGIIQHAIPIFIGCTLLCAAQAQAGVTNPNISVIGNMIGDVTSDPADPDRNRPRLSFEEAEVMFDDYLNPYAKGTFVLAFGADGAEVEEAFFEIVRGLPYGLGLKAGKFRQDFGRLNPQHPHAYAFIDVPTILQAYMPGEESFNDVGVTLSELIPIGPVAATISGTVVSGSTFRSEADSSAETRLGWNARWRNFLMVGSRSSLEFGVSAASGISEPQYGMRTQLFGVDFKTKLYTAPTDYLTWQGEWISLRKDVDNGSGMGVIEKMKPTGFYTSADYTFRTRYYIGAKLEDYQQVVSGTPKESRVGLYGGFGLLEESTLFRFLAEKVNPAGGSSYNRFLLQAIFSMGPHKAHQF
jgi:hypothetical protein